MSTYVDFDAMERALPEMAADLAKIMIDEVLPMYRQGIVTMDDCASTASITGTHKGARIKFSLSVELAEVEGDSGSGDDE